MNHRIIILNARSMINRKYQNTPVWAMASHLFGVGSTTATQICIDAGFNPECKVKDLIALITA